MSRDTFDDEPPEGARSDTGGLIRYFSDKCRYTGCDRPRHKGAKGGWGFCAKHARNFHRWGHPGGLEVKTKEALLDEAHAYGDHPERPERALALGRAAVEFMIVRGAGQYTAARRAQAPRLVPIYLPKPPGQFLLRAALAYTEHDTEASEASFLAAQKRLELAAVAFCRSIPVSLEKAAS